MFVGVSQKIANAFSKFAALVLDLRSSRCQDADGKVDISE